MALAKEPSPYSCTGSYFSPDFHAFPDREILEDNSSCINDFTFRTTNLQQNQHQAHDQSLINFNSSARFEKFIHNNESLITFEHTSHHLPFYMNVSSDEKDDFPRWDNFSSQSTVINKTKRESENQDLGDSIQAIKKQCTSSNTKAKGKFVQSKEPQPQSTAAKNRRERISERLKVLQELVPNGSKVDMVTMLEKAISYVKFLQLQVKVLATDEFWPMEGGKAPNIAQVKEAIDALLS